MTAIPPEFQKTVHIHDHVVSHEELRPLAVVEGFNKKRKRWEQIFTITEWASECGSEINDAPHYTRLRMTYVRQTPPPSPKKRKERKAAAK